MASVLVVDRDPAVVSAFRRCLQGLDVTVLSTHTAANASEMLAKYRIDVVVVDTATPDGLAPDVLREIHGHDAAIPVILITASGTANAAIEAIACGAFDYVYKPLQPDKMRELVVQACRSRQLQSPTERAKESASCGRDAISIDSMIGSCLPMQEVYKAIGRVASKKVNVLILGESGTGKELVAEAIQRHSTRSAAQFLAVNCAAIPEPLLESELFGHEKGAFTGADSKRVGKFEQCSGGTLFLDEVGDMTPIMQSKVLRVLQEGRFERVGGNKTVETDVRIIAATNRNLEQMVSSGQFRADLYYRLNVFNIQLPPLRERVADIPLLVEHFLRTYCRELDRSPCTASPETLELLSRYSWPGNVRELQSVLKRAVLRVSGPVLMPEYLPGDLVTRGNHVMGFDDFIDERLRAGSTTLHAEALAFIERAMLTKVLKHTGGNQSQAAKILNITRGTLRSKIRELGIMIHQAVQVEAADSEPALPASPNIEAPPRAAVP
ncbi:MAG: sigma-54 dependent transcriptional regulator [Planctomycetaceae bacterium]|nr:sigma-54 dependent transcriptional regulator [Planctomycetaceae bacterium]